MEAIPEISIITPTLNSAETLKKVLQSIKLQSFPQKKLEVLIVDGGSTDGTIEIAKKFGCKIIPNPQVGIMEAEILGYLHAKGRYLVGLAPDEVLENRQSLEFKYQAMRDNRNVKAVLPTGYKTPQDYHPINNYINEFGDPFSYFMYKDSKGDQFLTSDLEKNHPKIDDTDNYSVFSISDSKPLPLIELWAGGCMLDLGYVRKTFPQIKRNPYLIPLVFYLLNSKKKNIAVTKNDPTVHYSSGSLGKYLKKIRSRVEFNVFKTSMGRGGFSGREEFGSGLFKYKKFLFIPYSLSLVFPFIDSIHLFITRNNPVYLLHTPLCIYTSLIIVYYYFLKLTGTSHNIKLYGH